jgi:mannose-6-phosphate isomerase-like protein (cupin superfamily)
MTIHSKPVAEAEVLLFTDHIMTVRASFREADGLSIIEARAPYGASPPMHVHRNQDEYFHILEGTMRFSVGGREVVAHAGQTVVAPKTIPHTFRVESPAGVRVLTITKGPDFETMVRETGVPTDMAEVAEAMQPSPEQIGALVAACARNNIEVVGPPLGPKA